MSAEPISILVVHPDADTRDHYEAAIKRSGCGAVIDCRRSAAGKDLADGRYHLVLVGDTALVDDKFSFAGFCRRHGVTVPYIIIASESDSRHAVAALRSGASDFLRADADPDLIAEGVRHAANENDRRSCAERPDTHGPVGGTIISQSETMKRVLALAERVADSDATILIQGESGTGKELLARHIHASGRRRGQRFVAMNCAALPEQLVESELFGYEKGAFTGAAAKKQGRFEQARGGTLLLDEISEMPLSMQAKLLRVLQEKEIDRVGGDKPVPVDVRVIATTNRDLRDMAAEGEFREDLYYRLRVIPLTVPPLRERAEDIARLVTYFIEKHGPAAAKDHACFTDDAMETLCVHPWPGNVRELENTVMRALLICPGQIMDTGHLLLESNAGTVASGHGGSLVGMTVQDVEKELIHQTLTHVNQNRTHAAKMLGISIRTLRNKLNAYQNRPESVKGLAAEG